MIFSKSGRVYPTRVFFVRVADKGLKLDAASRKARWFKVESSKLKGEGAEADSRELTVDSLESEAGRGEEGKKITRGR
jgi:hypothetical protein